MPRPQDANIGAATSGNRRNIRKIKVRKLLKTRTFRYARTIRETSSRGCRSRSRSRCPSRVTRQFGSLPRVRKKRHTRKTKGELAPGDLLCAGKRNVSPRVLFLLALTSRRRPSLAIDKQTTEAESTNACLETRASSKKKKGHTPPRFVTASLAAEIPPEQQPRGGNPNVDLQPSRHK